MLWVALFPSQAEDTQAWAWRCLQFTPRVMQMDEAVLAEVSSCLRLWGGADALWAQWLDASAQPLHGLCEVQWAQGATARIALAVLRLQRAGLPTPPAVPDGLPLSTLSAALDCAGMLERMGCRTWSQLRALPRAGIARRFGAALLDALDMAYGLRPENCNWLQLPARFDQRLELPALASTAPELLWSAQRLLAQLQAWLQARHCGVLELELEWTHDLRRIDGEPLPPHEALAVRTAQPAQGMAHLRRLVAEQLARTPLRAPVNHLRLRTVSIVPWQAGSHSLLPDDEPKGERLHQLVERLSVRLGAQQVLCHLPHHDHRPEHMQRWVEARGHMAAAPSKPSQLSRTAKTKPSTYKADETRNPAQTLHPTWLLPQPLPLAVHAEKPHYHGPLRLLAGPQRLETGWWEAPPAEATPSSSQGLVLRDYFIARSEALGLLWVFRERPLLSNGKALEAREPRWFLQGFFA